jgi:hypothetical protein
MQKQKRPDEPKAASAALLSFENFELNDPALKVQGFGAD